MSDIIVILILVAIVGGALHYIVKAKKSGIKCIGCPSSKTCSSNKNSTTNESSCCSCGCSCNTDIKNKDRKNIIS